MFELELFKVYVVVLFKTGVVKEPIPAASNVTLLEFNKLSVIVKTAFGSPLNVITDVFPKQMLSGRLVIFASFTSTL